MRPSLFFFLLPFLLFSCAKSEEAEEVNVQTYASGQLSYPESPLSISQTTRDQFISKSFSPWTTSAEVLLGQLESFPGKSTDYLEKYLADDSWYGENKKAHTRNQRQEIVGNAGLSNFPNFLQKGVVIHHTDLRRVPTERPGFDRFNKAGEGYPFDYFQETGLWANTPLQLLHISRDKQWCYVISPIYKGWVQMKDIGIADQSFISNWMTGNYALPLSDQLLLSDSATFHALQAKIGMLLPYREIDGNTLELEVLYSITDQHKMAQTLKAVVPKSKLALDDFRFDRTNLKPLVDELLANPYGWGGYLENRDCSSMIRDLLGTYKIWLPRDSGDQMEVGEHLEFPDSRAEKIALIKEKGIPFLTILRRKGHNMLYVGNDEAGNPLILHAIWGLKSSFSDEDLAENLKTYPLEGMNAADDGQIKGRYIIGEAVITSVLLGDIEALGTTPQIDQMYAMTTLSPK